MTPLVVFLILSLSFAVLLLGVSVVVQSYLYSETARMLPLRALIGGLVAAGFLTFWVSVNTRAETKDRYGTLFEFNSTTTKPFDQFTAIRRHNGKDADGKRLQSKAKFNQSGTAYLENNDPLKPFKLTTSDYLTTAIEVREGENSTLFNAELFVPKDGKPEELVPAGPDAENPVFSRGQVRVFHEANGTRYIEFSQLGTPGPIQSPSRGAWAGAVALNLFHFVVWFIVFWLILRFSSGAAIGFAAGMTLAIMFFLMPILFERVTPKPSTAGGLSCWQTNAA